MSGATTLFINASQVVTCEGPPRARRGREMSDAMVRERVGIAVDADGRILEVAADAELRRTHPNAEVIDCGRGVLTPGFVDSHTHAIFGRARYEEPEMRAAGIGYLEIAKRGGGIHSSVRDVRERSEDELFALAAELAPENVAAGVNSAVNAALQAGKPIGADAQKLLVSQTPLALVERFGPVDEPGFLSA